MIAFLWRTTETSIPSFSPFRVLSSLLMRKTRQTCRNSRSETGRNYDGELVDVYDGEKRVGTYCIGRFEPA